MNASRIWIIAAVLVSGAVLVLGWVLGASTFLGQASMADAEREGVEQTNAVELAELAQMKQQFEQIGQLRVDLAKLRISVPGEADTDFVYTLLGGIQASTGATVATITTGEATPYGAAGAEAPTDTAPSGATAAVPELYTVPVTVTFQQVEAAKVLAFAHAMQTGPRLLLVTGVSGDGAGSSTITAYMFVLYDPEAPRGGAAQALAGQFVLKNAGKVAPSPSPAPEPTESAEDEAVATPTPSPTP